MWTDLINEFSAGSGLPVTVVVTRTLATVVFCGLIGLERERSRRPAGLRTHMLIGLAACIYSLLTLALLSRASDFGDTVRMDPLRIIEAVTSGVAFLAAGLIVFSQGKVRGLTTGASMWVAAAVGVASGLGEWVIAGMTTVLTLIIIALVRKLEKSAGTYHGNG
ncbi:MAG: MgtC/SapB family protein [Sulfitobacter sp.]|jgi:putative Mg2+ transporter-C (MgtC) family protein|uniref:MgtC/SapB family protein n=1 Tax=Sulfitobacter sp. TaxID=1903071 RepID=UPI000C0D7BE1|nr:preprotein translocase subunit TatA [Roseobacter sp.]MBV49073.1 preprotein translocase subunit TatA [Roseobacter sp.]PHR05283.1 MAG: preprotein translocase subunit TatA [Sulfitobacter sp.]THF73706.1 MAG: MgtC/SapB family protein [Sulfitobacter sp. SK025]|tara:strand:+ start:9023 stop:9514 length:492 start_codon:yes stop_codon:yes gene_type:complete